MVAKDSDGLHSWGRRLHGGLVLLVDGHRRAHGLGDPIARRRLGGLRDRRDCRGHHGHHDHHDHHGETRLYRGPTHARSYGRDLNSDPLALCPYGFG